MIKHIVFFRLAAVDTAQRSSDLETIAAGLRSLIGQIPELHHLEVGGDLGVVDTHWDAALLTEFASVADQDRYQRHPEHVRVLGIVNPLVSERAVVDYQT